MLLVHASVIVKEYKGSEYFSAETRIFLEEIAEFLHAELVHVRAKDL